MYRLTDIARHCRFDMNLKNIIESCFTMLYLFLLVQLVHDTRCCLTIIWFVNVCFSCNGVKLRSRIGITLNKISSSLERCPKLILIGGRHCQWITIFIVGLYFHAILMEVSWSFTQFTVSFHSVTVMCYGNVKVMADHRLLHLAASAYYNSARFYCTVLITRCESAQ